MADATPLASLTKLYSVDASDTKIRSLPDLSQLNSLEEMALNRTKISDLSSLIGRKNLELWLEIKGCPIKDIQQLLKISLGGITINKGQFSQKQVDRLGAHTNGMVLFE